jgi:hypothetical protein
MGFGAGVTTTPGVSAPATSGEKIMEVNIYKDPITRKKLEGRAKLIGYGRVRGFTQQGPVLDWKVEFLDGSDEQAHRAFIPAPEMLSAHEFACGDNAAVVGGVIAPCMFA